ncbi:11817_t:CDS:2 [Ambispora leptoticha]|uniref:11817_t:CDS:1 n=1 Tax=Ambispora leptoticha TaxID=144679 RepID=A0A9N9A710_9GLOM|nr:11817_t:CDS:2 [Ambispora leptoticha]
MTQESPSRLSASGNLRNVCRKLGKNESQSIYCFFEFGKAIVIRLNELLEKGQKKPREKLNQEVHKYFPDGTSLILGNQASRDLQRHEKAEFRAPSIMPRYFYVIVRYFYDAS